MKGEESKYKEENINTRIEMKQEEKEEIVLLINSNSFKTQNLLLQP